MLKVLFVPSLRSLCFPHSFLTSLLLMLLLFPPTGVMFDILFNLHKFMRFEARDPFQEKLRREEHRSDWDRYAHIEYNRLAQEEEG
jgi:hypothetical protein